MFWGITIENGKRYSQIVEAGYHVSMAALEFNAKESEAKKNVSIMIEHNKSQFLLCSLRHGLSVQQNLDLNFVEGEEVTFFIVGPGTVHLTGYLLDTGEDDEFGSEPDDSEFEMTDAESDDDKKSILKRKSSEENNKNAKKAKTIQFKDLNFGDDDDDESDEMDDEPKLVKKPKKKAKQQQKGDANNKQPATNGPQTPTGEATGKKKRKKKKKKNKGDNEAQTPTEAPKTPNAAKKGDSTAPKKGENEKTPQSVRKIVGGTSVEDMTVGNGPVAKRGRFVQIAYVGRLTNNKVFDSSKKDSPLGFRIGNGEVIKGLDLGIEGMKVGGKRKLVIPPQQGYGKQSSGPIPANSTLQFEIELKSVK